MATRVLKGNHARLFQRLLRSSLVEARRRNADVPGQGFGMKVQPKPCQRLASFLDLLRYLSGQFVEEGGNGFRTGKFLVGNEDWFRCSGTEAGLPGL